MYVNVSNDPSVTSTSPHTPIFSYISSLKKNKKHLKQQVFPHVFG